MKNAREDIMAIYQAAIPAVNPARAVKDHVRLEGSVLKLFSKGNEYKSFNLGAFKKIIVTGSGKATSSMAKAVEDILGGRISTGCITVKYGYIENLSRIEIIEASHPEPDLNGIRGAEKIREILQSAGGDDLVISLISGGCSALLPLPPPPITLEDKRITTGLLLKCGASIQEINSVRKHMSLVKGGNLARIAYPATVINLMISDVVGDRMDVIGSGPFVPDNSTFGDALSILGRYNLLEKVPAPALSYISDGAEGRIAENPGPVDPVFRKVTNLIIASNIIALKSARAAAEKLGYNAMILSSLFEGDTKEAAGFHSAIAREVISSSNPLKKPACILSGGETTVRVSGAGLGGRNMEFAIQSAVLIDGMKNVTIASIGTDGTDGPTDAAGAVADGGTVNRAVLKGLNIMNYIQNSDSYHFFREIGDLIITGPTNTNVMDIRIMILDE